jgi:hypothetical protein
MAVFYIRAFFASASGCSVCCGLVLCVADTLAFTPVALVSLVWHKKDLGKKGKKNASLGEHELRSRIARIEERSTDELESLRLFDVRVDVQEVEKQNSP